MKRYLIILFCFLGSAAIAQQSAIDSLLRVAGKSTGTDQVDLLNAVASPLQKHTVVGSY